MVYMGMFDDDPLKAPVVLPDEEPDEPPKEVKKAPAPPPATPQATAQPEPIPTEDPSATERYDFTPQKKDRRWLKILLIAILLGAIGFAVWYFLLSKPKTDTSEAATTPTVSDEPIKKTETSDIPDAKLTDTAEASFIGVTLMHPSAWTATVAEDKSSIKVESPEFSYLTQDKGTVTGFFRVYIRKGAREVDGKYIGRGVAVQDSEPLTYDDPAVGQRQETFLTRYGYDEADNFAFFLVAGNFDLDKGQTLGPDYGKEPETYIVVGGFTDTSLTDDLAMNQVAATYTDTSNAYKQAVAIIKSLQLQ